MVVTIKRGQVTLIDASGLIGITSADGHSVGSFQASDLLDISCLLLEYQRRRALETTQVIPTETVAHLRKLSTAKDGDDGG